MDPADLDGLLDRELKGLPRPRAPHTLLPRVLAAARAQPSPSVPPTGWFTWSWARRVASLAAIVVLLALAGAVVAAPPAPVSKAAETAAAAATLIRVFSDVLLQPLAVYFFGLGVLFALACAVAWAAMEAALGGASHR
jgi:hypothetical protein